MKTSAKNFVKNTWKHKSLLLFALPAVVLLIMFSYVPMAGAIVAFKRYTHSGGIWGSEWVGLKNFGVLFVNKDTTIRMLRNTVGYFFLFQIVNTTASVALAIALNELRSKKFAKISQTIMIMPTFISYIAISFIARGLLSSDGIINDLITAFGGEVISFYSSPQYWPLILVIVNAWKGVGYGSVLYLSALAGMDQEIFESAKLDGATRWQQIRYMTLPLLTPMIAILSLMSLKGIMTSNTGLFYQVTRNIGVLYPTTQTVDSYMLDAMMGQSTANYGTTGAVSLFQSVVGCVVLVVVNTIVRKISPENAMF